MSRGDAIKRGTSRECSWKCLRGLAWAGAATSHTLMLPSPHEDTRMFSFSCVHDNIVFLHELRNTRNMCYKRVTLGKHIQEEAPLTKRSHRSRPWCQILPPPPVHLGSSGTAQGLFPQSYCKCILSKRLMIRFPELSEIASDTYPV